MVLSADQPRNARQLLQDSLHNVQDIKGKQYCIVSMFLHRYYVAGNIYFRALL